MWFEECQEMFMRVEVQAKEYIDATESETSISINTKDHVSNDVVETYSGLTSPPQNNSGMIGMQSVGNQSTNTSAGNTSVVNNQQNNQNTAGDSCGFEIEKPKTKNQKPKTTLESVQHLTQTLNTRLNRSTARAMPSLFFAHVSKANH